MIEELTVTDPALVRMLGSIAAAGWLAPYFAEPRSIASAAEYLDEPIGKTHYWTRRWHDAGLLEVVERRARAGRPIAFYRTVARRFVVPAECLPEEYLDRQLDAVDRRIRDGFRQLAAAVSTEPLLIWQPEGQRGTSMDRGGGARYGALQSSFELLLDAQEREQLRAELGELRDRWVARAGSAERNAERNGHEEYLISLAIVRSPD